VRTRATGAMAKTSWATGRSGACAMLKATEAAENSPAPFVLSLSYREAAQDKVTRVTVGDRRPPAEPAPYGTQVARRLSALP
jgi:hypothetical protein